MSSCATRSRARGHSTLIAALAVAATLAGCSSGGTKPANTGQGAGGPAAKRAEAVCARDMPERSLIDLTDISPKTESQLRNAMQGAARAVDGLHGLNGNRVASMLAGDLARAHTLGTSYLQLAKGDALDEAATRFEELKRWLAQLQSDATLRHAPSCAVHAYLD